MENSFLHQVQLSDKVMIMLKLFPLLSINSAGVYLLGGLIYWFFASGQVQPWAIQDNPLVESTDDKDVKNGHINDGIEMKDEK